MVSFNKMQQHKKLYPWQGIGPSSGYQTVALQKVLCDPQTDFEYECDFLMTGISS